MSKNPDLCERAHCRQRYTQVVSGWDQRKRRGWTLHVCEAHVELYRSQPGHFTITPRPAGRGKHGGQKGPISP